MLVKPSLVSRARRSAFALLRRAGTYTSRRRATRALNQIVPHAAQQWNFGRTFKFFPWLEQLGKGMRSMKRAQSVSIFSRGRLLGRVAVMSMAVLCLLATPSRSPAQDAGVSGIAPGPANARGLNGSVSDPSGIGNAAKVPAIPPPAISPVPVPTLSGPAATYRTFPVQRSVRMRRTRFATSGSRRSATRAAVRENDRLLDHKITSICRGC
jgi:hypothetical protein